MRVPLAYRLLLPFFLLPGWTESRGVVITGRITQSADAKPIAAATVVVIGTNRSTSSDATGRYTIAMPMAMRGDTIVLEARRIGYQPVQRQLIVASDSASIDFALPGSANRLGAVVTADPAHGDRATAPAAKDASREAVAMNMGGRPALAAPVPYVTAGQAGSATSMAERRPPGLSGVTHPDRRDPAFNTEQYDRIYENPFLGTDASPRSTFSIDVDRASYSNVRRFIDQGLEPPKDAVRIEELVNYFSYDYPEPRGASPVSITAEVAPAPWKPAHRLVRIGLKAKSIDKRELPASNLVFLIDVSGSMAPPNRLPLVKAAFRMLVNELREEDRVSIVVYAGAAGTVLSPTSGADKTRIMDAIERLDAGGSTAGGAGLKLAYDIARKTHMRGGNNRVILATDGDFNVGMSSDAEMVRLIEERRGQGTFLTVLGFGMGNLKDSRLEKLADKGNGNYAYIDDIMEARKTLVNEFGGTMVTVAKDVKLQVEFNPARVAAYRLIGYENRLLRDQDFNDDAKDAGEIGSGHTVTALYEIIPVGARTDQVVQGVDPLRYQTPPDGAVRAATDELVFVRLRYKEPTGDVSKLIERPVVDRGERPSADLTFASAVAAFGLVLRDSEYKGNATLDDVLTAARRSVGEDPHGYRADFVRLVETARQIRRAER